MKTLFSEYFILIFSNSHDLWRFNNRKEKSVYFTVKNKFKKFIILFIRMTSVYLGHYNESTFKKRKESFLTAYRVCCALFGRNFVQIKSNQISRRFSKFIGEKSPIQYVVEGLTLFLVWCDNSHFLNINIWGALWKIFI